MAELDEAQVAAYLERDRQHISGRVTYQRREYYLVGEGTSDQGAWYRLMFMDGSKTFFADQEACDLTRSYRRPRSLAGLRDFVRRAQAGQFRHHPKRKGPSHGDEHPTPGA